VRVIPLYSKLPAVDWPAAPPPLPALPVSQPAAAIVPPAEDDPLPAASRRHLIRHWHEAAVDRRNSICARHGGRKVTKGQSWRCIYDK
jgi:hypothetical protein